MKTASKSKYFTLKKNRKIKIFLVFLVLTSIIWLLIALSKNHTSIAIFKVEYENVPSEKLLQNKPVSSLELLIEAPGFTLLRYKIKQHKVKFTLSNLGKTNQMYYLLPNAQIPYLNKQFKGDIQVLNVLKDTVFIELGNNISKKVPIHPNVDVKFKLGYNFIEKLKINPDSVLISGPKKMIDSIRYCFSFDFCYCNGDNSCSFSGTVNYNCIRRTEFNYFSINEKQNFTMGKNSAKAVWKIS